MQEHWTETIGSVKRRMNYLAKSDLRFQVCPSDTILAIFYLTKLQYTNL